MPRPLNILLIMTDQHRADCLGCAGHPHLHTPQLDRLAAEGVRCTRAYCTTPLCVPSRTSLFTGQPARAHRTGMINRITLTGDDAHLPGLLARAGYQQALVGKNHAFTDDCLRQWDFVELYDLHGKEPHAGCSPLTEADRRVRRWRSDPRRVPVQEGVVHEPQPGPLAADPNVSQTEHALRFLAGRDRARPFFLYYSFESPHFPYVVPEPYFSRVEPGAMPGPLDSDPLFADKPMRLWLQHAGQSFERLTPADFRRIQATYCAQVMLVDEQIGRVLDALRATGELDRTVVVFCSDHGDFWGHHGMVGKTNAVYEELLRVPMIWRVPGLASRRSDAPVELIDIVPTLLDVLDLPQPPDLPGRSLLPWLCGADGGPRDRIIAESRLDAGPVLTRAQAEQALRHRDQLKAAEGHGWFGPRIRGWTRSLLRPDGMKLILNENDVTELYDLNRDPHEGRNLAALPASASVVAEMTAELATALPAPPPAES